MYDDLQVAALTASGGAASNGLNFRCRIHKVTLHHADGTAVMAASLFDAATATGTAKVAVSTNLADGTTFERFAQSDFPNPVLFTTGVSLTLTGAGTVRVFYTRD